MFDNSLAERALTLSSREFSPGKGRAGALLLLGFASTAACSLASTAGVGLLTTTQRVNVGTREGCLPALRRANAAFPLSLGKPAQDSFNALLTRLAVYAPQDLQ